jgi:phosphopantetheinyl transferase (holo-ACP synthase)
MAYCGKHAFPVTHTARGLPPKSHSESAGKGWDGSKTKRLFLVNHEGGQPFLNLSGDAQSYIQKRRIHKIHLSLTHTKKYSAAMVLLETID